jgi:hypothetical protein
MTLFLAGKSVLESRSTICHYDEDQEQDYFFCFHKLPYCDYYYINILLVSILYDGEKHCVTYGTFVLVWIRQWLSRCQQKISFLLFTF